MSSVYTTLTTCPVTSLVTSGSTSFEEITTTISTVTRTTTSTLCTKCVAPPSKPAGSPSSPGETAASSLPYFTIVSLSQPSLALSSISAFSVTGAQGVGSLSSQPEVPGSAGSSSRGLVFPTSVSLTVLATLEASTTLEFPGYSIVPSPISIPGSPRERINSNATSSIIPVYTPALLGNAYGGGFVGTPSIYVTPLPYPNGPSSGVPPGYGSPSSITVVQNNVTTILTSLGASSTSAAGLQSTTAIGVPVFTATIASNVSVLIGSYGASNIPATSSEFENSTPTYISLSPFGGEVGQESGSGILGVEASLSSSATASVQTSNSDFGGANVITALIAATSPAAALSAEASQVSNAVLSSLAAAGLSTSSVNVQVAVVGSSTTSVIGSPGVTEASIVPATTIAGIVLSSSFPSSGVNVETILASTPTSGNIGDTIIPSLPAEQSAGPLVTLALGPSLEQTAAAGQPAISIPTLNRFASSTTAPLVLSSPVVGANGSTAIAVVPSPVVGANGLTSLAIFSTPIAPAAGLTSPSVLLTPVVGANGLTSLAVVATPVVGANGLTSLAIGFETETSSAAGQSDVTPTPVEGFVLIQSPSFTPQVSGGIPAQVNIAASGINNIVVPSGSGESPESGGSGGGNYSIHVLLNPTAATHFQGSAIRHSLGFGVGLFAMMVFFVLL